MVSKIVFFIFVAVMVGLGSFFLIYGIKGGLIQKRILKNAWRQDYVTGRNAVIRGIFYIFLGILSIFALIIGILDALKK